MQALSDRERMDAGSFASYFSSLQSVWRIKNVGTYAGGTEGININSI